MDYEIKVWTNEKLGKEIAIDTETTIAPFHTYSHKLVTCQAYDGRGVVYFIKKTDIKKFFLKHYSSKLIFQNAPFDLDVLMPYIGQEWIYELIDDQKILDTKILYKLYHLAVLGFVANKSSLKDIAKKLLNVDLDKDGGVRTTFDQFLNTPILEIPKEHLEYAALDAKVTFDAYCNLLALIKPHDLERNLLSHDIQIKGDYSLNKIYKNGIGFDLELRDDWLQKTNKDLVHLQEKLATYGWVRGVTGIKQTYTQIMEFIGIADKLPRTENGDISSKRDDLVKFKDYPFISDYLQFIETEKSTTFVRNIETSVLHPRYNVLLNTGRTSCSSPNIQQLPRAGDIRGMFIPKTKGNVFVDIDYSSLELSTLAQVTTDLFGYSKMGELINQGKDLHTYAASKIFRVPEDKVTKSQRQFAKIPNFGFGANMSTSTFVEYAAGYGEKITEEFAKEVKAAWLDAFPEMRQYFNTPRKNVDLNNSAYGETFCHYTLTGRKRAACTYTAFLNTGFQGLASDGLKLALYEISKQGYHIVAEIHDQVVVECSKEDSTKVLKEVSDIMVREMKKVVPDVDVSTEGQIVERFCK